MKQLFTTLILLVCCTLALSAQTIKIYLNNQTISTYNVSDVDSVVFKKPSIGGPVILACEFPITNLENPKAGFEDALNSNSNELKPYGEIGTIWQFSGRKNYYKIIMIPDTSEFESYACYNVIDLNGYEEFGDGTVTFANQIITYNGIQYRVYGRCDTRGFDYDLIVKLKYKYGK